MRAETSHLAFLDGLRGVASFYVLLHHIWLAAYPRAAGHAACSLCVDAPAWTGWLRFGHLAVVAFIVVSGFSLALSPVRSGYRLAGGFHTYITRRARRIVPPYWVALLLSCLVVVTFTGKYTGTIVDAKAIAVHALLLNDVVDSAKPNGTFWSIAVEWQIYFVFPFMLLCCRRLGTSAMVTLVAATSITAFLLGTLNSRLSAQLGLDPDALAFLSKLLHLSPQFLALFALGVAAAGVMRPDRAGPSHAGSWAALGSALSLATVCLLWVIPVDRVEENFFWIDLLAGAATASLVAAFAERPGMLVPRILGSALPRWAGQSSYSLYLIHGPLLDAIALGLVASGFAPGNARFEWLVVLVIPVAVLASRLFWRAFERPFMKHRPLAGGHDGALDERIAA